MIHAERTHRQARSITCRIGGVTFPILKDIDTLVFADTPIDEGQVSELATGTFPDARNAIFIGGTGTGKTHSCIAFASAIIGTRAGGAYSTWSICSIGSSRIRPPVAVAGRPSKLLRHDLIVIDEFGYLPFSQSDGQLLPVSKLYENKSLLIITNLVLAVWPQVFGYAKMTTATLNRSPLRHHRDG